MDSVPRTHRYYGSLRLPVVHPEGLDDSPVGTVLALVISFSPSASTHNDEPGFCSPGSPTGFSGTETTESPEFPSDPLDACPAPIRPRRDRNVRLFDARGVAFHAWHGVGSRDKRISGLNRTAYIFAVYASQWRLPEHHARLASGRWPTLPARDSTRRICSEGFRYDSSHVISSPFPELCSAHATYHFATLWVASPLMDEY